MNRSKQALILGLSAVLLWSTVATAFKIALRYLDVLSLVSLASVVSTLILVFWLAAQSRVKELAAALRMRPFKYLAMACINPLLYYVILLTAYDLLPAQQAQTINYTWAIILSLLAVPVLGQRLLPKDLVAVAVGYLGVVIIATEGSFNLGAIQSTVGLGLALISTLVWAGFWLANTRLQEAKDVALAAMFVMSSPLAIAYLVVSGGLSEISWQGLGAAVYVGLFEMGVTFLLWSQALSRAVHVARVANLIFLAPVFSLVLIQMVLDEPVHPATLVGFALIVPAILLQQREP
ncbi:MAG: DMT family transporter [Halieaceae bacterium]|nr:DMT family transporter [Halieaceae bacterium]